MKRIIENEQDIRLLVDTFYDKVNQDDLLSPVFNEEAGVNWEDHLTKMYRFWGTQLIGTQNYNGRPFPPHAMLHIGKEHFERWLSLFHRTVDELFYGLTAELAKQKATNIAEVFMWKMGVKQQGKEGD